MADINLTDYQKDIFREIGNIGIGHGATALSTMVSREVVIDIPDIEMVNVEKIFDKPGEFLISNCKLAGDLDGFIVGIFDKTNALRLVDLMYFQEPGTTLDISEEVKSAFNEMVNVVGGLYLNAMADMLNLRLLPKPPIFSHGSLIAIKDTFMMQFNDVKDSFFVKTKFTIDGKEVIGDIYLILDNKSNMKVLNLIDTMQT